MGVDRLWFAAIVALVVGPVLFLPILIVFIAARDRYASARRLAFGECVRCLRCSRNLGSQREANCIDCNARFTLDALWAQRPR